jgi:hypothetical protein
MLALESSDFMPLESFELAYRFGDAMYRQVAPDHIKRLQPLTPVKAREFAAEARDLCLEGRPFRTRIETSIGPIEVRKQLRALPPPKTSSIVVSWNDHLALLTDWELFTAYWDDFCYDSSDDVSVLPTSGDWVLCFRHFGVIEYGLRQVR